MNKIKKLSISLSCVLSTLVVCLCIVGIANVNSNENQQNQIKSETKTQALFDNSYVQESFIASETLNEANEQNAEDQNNIGTNEVATTSEEESSEIRTANLFEDAPFYNPLIPFVKSSNNISGNGTLLYYKIEENNLKNSTLYLRSDNKTDYTEFDSGSPAPWVDDKQYMIKTVIIDNEIQPSATIGWFGCATGKTSGKIKLSNIKTIKNLDYLDMSNVTNANCMFVGSDLLDTPEVDDNWFTNIKPSAAIGICNYTSLDNTFLTNMAKAIAPSVEDASYAFANNKSNLTNLNLTDIEFNKATNTSRMFYNNTALTSITANTFIADKGVDTVDGMFENCTNLSYIGLVSNTNWYGKTSSNDQEPFKGCTKLIPAGSDAKIIHANNVNEYGFFKVAAGSQAYAVYNSSAKTMTFYYDENKETHTDGTTWNVYMDCSNGHMSPYNDWNSSAENLPSDEAIRIVINSSFANAPLTSTYGMFASFYNATSISGLAYINTSNVTNMASMFQELATNASSFSIEGLSNWDTSKVSDMSYMFFKIGENATTLSLSGYSNWNTCNVVYMTAMFQNTPLQTINISGWNSSALSQTDSTKDMFYNSNSISEISIGVNWGKTLSSCSLHAGPWFNTITGKSYSPYEIPTSTAGTYVIESRLPKYNITVQSSATNYGTVSADKSEAHIGETVTLTTTTNTGGRFKGFTSSPSLTITDVSDTVHTFEMPAQAVNITANFDEFKYIITFSKEGAFGESGGSAPEAVEVSPGSTFTFTSAQGQGSLTSPLSEYNKFAGWCTVQDPTATNYDNVKYYQYHDSSEHYSSTTIAVNNDITLYAQWRKRVNLYDSTNNIMYAPIFKPVGSANEHPAAEFGYHFYESESSQYEILTTSEKPIWRIRDLIDSYKNKKICVEVDPGKGAIDKNTGCGSGKCLAIRGQASSFNNAKSEIHKKAGEYWVGNDWTNIPGSSKPTLYWKNGSEWLSADLDAQEAYSYNSGGGTSTSTYTYGDFLRTILGTDEAIIGQNVPHIWSKVEGYTWYYGGSGGWSTGYSTSSQPSATFTRAF